MHELDTTELRALAVAATREPPLDDEPTEAEIAAALRFAATTIDALRAELHGQMTSTETERSYAHVVETLRRVTNERAALRRIIAETPHGTGCESFWRKDGSRPCTCWKSRIEETR